jgi:hypothetical protein
MVFMVKNISPGPMNTWNNRGSRELIGHSKHFGTRFAIDSVTVYPIIFPENQGQVRLTQADFYFFRMVCTL